MEEPYQIAARPLTAHDFTAYGEVFSVPGSETRESADCDIPLIADAKLCLSLSRRAPASLPFTTKIMERHLQSPQIFIPLKVSRFLVIVAPATGAPLPEPERTVAFIGRAGQALSYRTGTWHHPFTVLDEQSQYASLMFRDGSPLDEEFVELDHSLLITA